jgi:hypothetical protein
LHATSQLPQFFGSVWRSVQPEGHTVPVQVPPDDELPLDVLEVLEVPPPDPPVPSPPDQVPPVALHVEASVPALPV